MRKDESRTFWNGVGKWGGTGTVVLLLAFLLPIAVSAQVVTSDQVITVSQGQSILLPQRAQVQRVSVGDPEIADAVVVSPLEVVVNARALGTTSVIVWDVQGRRGMYTVEVTVDAAGLERTLAGLFPGERISLTARGNTVILTGQASGAAVAARAQQVVEATGAKVVSNLAVQPGQQVLLQVRFAEVTRSALSTLRSELSSTNPDLLAGTGDWTVQTLSDGLVRLFLLDPNASLELVLEALRGTRSFRSLAEPNLLALDGQEASFLAGGEFPFPVPQSLGQIAIVWREFGVRLRFRPTMDVGGNIRLQVAPEVSALDFANALSIQGFNIPALTVRRAETEVILREGQTFAIAGLMDSNMMKNVDKIPFLGDIPILGALFQRRDERQSQTELLVLVTPRLVSPTEVAPPVPGGEPETWPWDRSLRRPLPSRPQPQN